MNDLFTEGGASAPTGLKIVRLEAENIKRIQAVQIKPDGNVVEITGRNGQGKSSILDSIWWCLSGRSAIQSAPIRKGADKARIELDLGAITVRRTFRKVEDGGFTTSIIVEAEDGARYPSPQRMLDKLMGELSIDPLAFMRMDSKAQLEMLRGFVTGFDFDDHDRQQRADYEQRTIENRRAKELRSQAAGMVVPEDLPAEPIDEAALTDELAQAGEHNGQIEARSANRQAARETIQRLEAERDAVAEAIPKRQAAIEQRRTAAVAEAERQIEALRAKIIAINAAADEEATNLHDEAAEDRARLDGEIEGLQKRLDEAGPLPTPIDVHGLRERIAAARTANMGIAARQRLRDAEAQAEAAESRSAALTQAMADRDAAKTAAIAAAKLPVDGIEFGPDGLLLNRLPLDQASDAEQLRISVAIAMAMHPKLRVIRVRDGNVLDADGMKLLADLAERNDAQVWIETVRSDDRMAFVIEDGRVSQGDTA